MLSHPTGQGNHLPILHYKNPQSMYRPVDALYDRFRGHFWTKGADERIGVRGRSAACATVPEAMQLAMAAERGQRRFPRSQVRSLTVCADFAIISPIKLFKADSVNDMQMKGVSLCATVVAVA